MARSGRLMRRAAPRIALKLHRNHFRTAEDCSDWRLSGFIPNRGVDTTLEEKPLRAATEASRRSRRYRFARVNAVFNPRKVLPGDEPEGGYDRH